MVAEFQMDGRFTDETFLNHSGLGSQDLPSLSYCLRFKMNFHRPPDSCLLSYSTQMDDNTLSIWIEQDLKNVSTPLKIKTCKFDSSDVCYIFHVMGVKPHQIWNHVCIILTSHALDNGNSMKWSMTLYWNGKHIEG